MGEKRLGLAIGVVTASATIAAALFLPKANALQFLTVLLMGIAGAYAGFTFSNVARKRDALVEMTNIAAYIAIALLGLWVTPLFLAAGYIWHGAWDAIHHKKIKLVQTKVPEWYIYGCALYDWAVGVFILLRLV